MDIPRSISKSNAIQVLRRANYDQALIDEVMSKVPDPIDFDRDGSILMQYGITRDRLMDRMGGSP
jgi:hypothetical protein